MFVCPVSNSWFLISEMSSGWCLTCRIQIRSADSMNGFFIFLFFFDSKYFFKGYSGFTQSWIIILQEFMSLIWNTLSNVRRLKIWVTEVVCNLSMNNSTTNKFKQSSRNPLWQRDMRYAPSLGHPYTVCVTFLQSHWRKAFLGCQQTANVSSLAAAHHAHML